MKEQELQSLIEQGVKSPSDNFADQVMDKVYTSKELKQASKVRYRMLIVASLLIAALSIFVKIPEIQYLNYTISSSPIVIPVLSLLFLLIIFVKLNESQRVLARLN